MGESALAAKPPIRGMEIPLLLRIKARNLYLIQNLSWVEIGKQCGYSPKSLAHLAHREKWTDEKRRRKAMLLKSSDAHVTAIQSEVSEAIASVSEQHAMQALVKTGEALERKDRDAAKDAQAFSATVKNLVGVAKILREPSKADLGADGAKSLNIFFMPAASPVSSEPKQVQAIDVKSVESVKTE